MNNTMHEIMKTLNNMIKKRIDLYFVHDEILGQKVGTCIIKYIRKIYLYLMSIQYIIVGHVHIVKKTPSLTGI